MDQVKQDHSLDNLLLLDGEQMAVTENANPYWVKFVVKQVPATKNKPHGIDYSITLHDPSGKRVIGFDNAHSIQVGSGPGRKTRIEYDHLHLGTSTKFYHYQDAGTLLFDFWKAVDEFLKEHAQ